MRRTPLLVLVAMLGTLLGLVLVAPGAAAARTAAGDGYFGREVVGPGARDIDPYHIAHVAEVQYRLRWLGLLDARVSGYFGSRTTAAVQAFQRRIGHPPTGTVDAATWRPLIKQTVRGRARVPAACRSAGSWACYDRSRHQVSLYRSGVLVNSWLVRGGSSSTPTRTGTFVVYLRDIDHYSSLFGAPMPYSQFFSGGQALHGSRLMMDPFVGHSHGCVNFYVEDARQLWRLTATRTLHVRVYGAWS
jgi:hypothetical protein